VAVNPEADSISTVLRAGLTLRSTCVSCGQCSRISCGDFLLAPASLSGSGATGSASPAPGVATHPGTRLRHGIRKPKIYTNGTVRYGLYTSSGEPQNDHEALQDDKWKITMDDELGSLQRNDTWHLVPMKSGENVIDCKWVYKIKRKSNGTIDRYKARLVAKGFK
jgi:hypothetical protein